MKISFFKAELTPELYRSGKNNSCLCWGLNPEVLGIAPAAVWNIGTLLWTWYTEASIKLLKILESHGQYFLYDFHYCAQILYGY